VKYDINGAVWSEENRGYWKYVFLLSLYVICSNKYLTMPYSFACHFDVLREAVNNFLKKSQKTAETRLSYEAILC
jgi:hypothetical protein